ncbi:MAG: chromosomal replication initiator protein DnaA [Desulfobulbaceae bacterium]|nr:chromosomal replication initiator protein DnaA [Desulfobulbaceae bacterium]
MVWNKVKESLKETLTDNIFQLWIEPLEFQELRGEQFYISSPDRYFSAYVKQNFSAVIEKQLVENGVVDAQVIFCEKAPPKARPLKVKKNKKKQTAVQMRLPSVPVNNSKFRNLHPRYTFNEFMVGESNILAESACRSMVTEDGLVGPCLYINSETGLGKSHLTHAVAHKVFSESPMTRLHYLTAKQFAAEMIRGIKNKTMDDFKQKYQENCDILLVEDIHSLTGKKKTQEELNDVLDSLIKSGKRVVLTANSAPRDLVGIDSEFKSRMTSGLVTSIKAPDVNTRCRIIEKKAMQQQLALDEESISFLGGHIRGDIRKIESALIGLRAKAQFTGGHIDMDLVREVVSSVVGFSQVLTASMICDLVSGQFKVSVQDLQSKSRKKAITVPRQIAMYLARKHTEDSLAQIGKAFNRDHSTVLHSIKVVSNKLVRDSSVNAQLEILNDKVKQL